jgi:hypothetical protein
MSESFDPDWTLAPAALLREWLAEHGHEPVWLAWTPEEGLLVLDVLGRRPLADAHAELLERRTGVPAQHWLNRERQYRTDLAAGRKDTTP